MSAFDPTTSTTTGLAEPVLTLVYAVAIGLSIATTALVVRRIGEKEMIAGAVGILLFRRGRWKTIKV